MSPRARIDSCRPSSARVSGKRRHIFRHASVAPVRIGVSSFLLLAEMNRVHSHPSMCIATPCADPASQRPGYHSRAGCRLACAPSRLTPPLPPVLPGRQQQRCAAMSSGTPSRRLVTKEREWTSSRPTRQLRFDPAAGGRPRRELPRARKRRGFFLIRLWLCERYSEDFCPRPLEDFASPSAVVVHLAGLDLRPCHGTEDISRHIAPFLWPTDPDPQSVVLVGRERFGDGPNSVVAARTAAALVLELRRRQVEVVLDRDEMAEVLRRSQR